VGQKFVTVMKYHHHHSSSFIITPHYITLLHAVIERKAQQLYILYYAKREKGSTKTDMYNIQESMNIRNM